MEFELQKGDLLFSLEGCQVCATNDANLAWMEWEREEDCELAFRLQRTLQRHALATNFCRRHGERALVVKQVEPLAVTVLAEGAPHEASVIFVGGDGATFSREEAERRKLLKASRLDVMEDAGLHVVRTLRARLGPLGVERLALRLRFGLTDDGCCLLQVPNPLECDLGTADHDALCNELGGDRN